MAMWFEPDAVWQQGNLCRLLYCLEKVFQTHGRSHVDRIKSCLLHIFTWGVGGKPFGQSPLDRQVFINCEANCFPLSPVCKCTHCPPGFENPVSHHMSPTCHWLSPRVEGVIRHVLKQFFFFFSVFPQKKVQLKNRPIEILHKIRGWEWR